MMLATTSQKSFKTRKEVVRKLRLHINHYLEYGPSRSVAVAIQFLLKYNMKIHHNVNYRLAFTPQIA